MAPIGGTPAGMKLVECPPEMRHALQVYIKRKRLKEKEEAEQSAALIRERKERELRIRRDNATLEKTKEELHRLQVRLEQLQKERHNLFAELKSVINLEAEQKRRKEEEYAKEKEEILARVGSHLPPPPPPPPIEGGGGKRAHSPGIDFLAAKIPALAAFPTAGGPSGSFFPLATPMPLRPPPPPPGQLAATVRFPGHIHASAIPTMLNAVKPPSATTISALGKQFNPAGIYRPPFY